MKKRLLPIMVLLLCASAHAWQFDASEEWSGEAPLQVESGKAGVRVAVPAAPAYGSPRVSYKLHVKGEAGTIRDNKVACAVEVLSGGGVTVSVILRDAKGESFAYREIALKPGLQELTWPVGEFAGSWGPEKNGVLDAPLRLVALQINQYPAANPAVLLFRAPQSTDNRQSVARPLMQFDRGEKWNLSANLQQESRAEGLIVKVLSVPKPGEKVVAGSLQEATINLRDIGSPDAIELAVDLLAGSSASLALELLDAKGERFSLTQKPLATGSNRLLWDLSRDVSGSWGQNKNGIIDQPVHLTAIRLMQYPAEEGAQLLLRSGQTRQRVPAIEAVDATLETGSPLHLLKVGDESKLAIQLHNRFPAQNAFRAELRLLTLTGEQRTFARDVSLAPDQTLNWPLPWPAQTPRGVWRCRLTLRDADGRMQIITRPTFAYLQPAGPLPTLNPEFTLGLNIRQQHWSLHQQELEAELAGTIGAQMARSGYTWESMEPEEGRFHFSAQDQLLALNARYGVHLMNLVAYTPQWAADPTIVATAKNWNDWNKSAPDPDKLERYVEQLAAHYKGRISLYEFWNEPELEFWRGTVEQFIECQKRVSRALKKVDPEAKLITSGFALAGMLRGKQGFQEKVLQEAQDSFDYHGFHQHGDFFQFQQVIEGPLAQMRQALRSDKPLFFDETGFYISGGNYLQQMENVIRKIVFARAIGARGYLWFDLRDDGYDTSNAEHNYGLITHDWYPKEGLVAYNTLARLLRDAHSNGLLLRNAQTTIAQFQTGNNRVLVLWRNGKAALGELLAIETDASAAHLIDFAGNESPLGILAGRIQLAVPERPAFLLLSNVTKEPAIGQGLVELIAGAATAVPGAPLTLTFSAQNLLPQEQEMTLRWQLPAGITATPAQKNLSIKAGEHQPVSFTLTAQSLPAGRVELNLDCLLNAQTITATIPLNIAAVLPTGSFPQEPQFTLDKREQVFSLMEHNPLTSHRIWKGPEDQSVTVALRRDDANLKIRIAVRDDVHVRSASAEKCYLEDGIQLALAIPGQQGHWEFGFCQLKNGDAGSFCWIRPDGATPPAIQATVQETGATLTYDIAIPLSGLALDAATLCKGIRFNLIVNDNDGEGRDGWIQIAPGIGESKSPELYPYLIQQ